MMGRTMTIFTNHVAPDGAAEGVGSDRETVSIYGMLPQERGIVDVVKKNGWHIGELKELLLASPQRKTPEEKHFLTCSPWQVMNYALQAELKEEFLRTLYPDDGMPKTQFIHAAQFYGYRTKIEFCFMDRDALGNSAPLSLAFHMRNGGSRRIALPDGCALASDAMNSVALSLCARLRDRGYIARDLKSLVVRESKSTGKLLAILYVKNESAGKISVEGIDKLSGFLLYYSSEKSPASVATKELWKWGDDCLSETVDGKNIVYAWDSFFQNNIPVFESAVSMMKNYVPEGARVTELYSGVGTIGLLLAQKSRHVHGVEIVKSSVRCAEENARANNIVNYSAVCLPAEKIDSHILASADVLVLDPPRAGMHPHLCDIVSDVRPPKILYLSCNPATQARDYALLRDLYLVDCIAGFDFYPQTPHCESLLILSLRP